MQTTYGIFFHQTKCVISIFTKHTMLDAHFKAVLLLNTIKFDKDIGINSIDIWTYQRLISKLNYLIKTRWDIGFVVFILSIYIQIPNNSIYK